jgi:hypothetical protein
MCDFRNPPIAIEEVSTGQRIDFIYNGSIPVGDTKSVNKQGVYYLAGSGSGYAYFDGQNWWNNRDDWGPISETRWKYWPEHGMPTHFTKYRFIFREEKCLTHFVLNWPIVGSSG